MKGLWKTHISGWKKDSKRKKTKLKHLIKDNLNVISKRENLPKHLYREDFKLVKLGTRKELGYTLKNTNPVIPFYKLRIYSSSYSNLLLGTTFAYLKGNIWIEINNDLLNSFKFKDIHIESSHIGFMKNPFLIENIKYNNEIVERDYSQRNIHSFIYNKPSVMNQYSYIRNYRKKPYQTFVDRITRRIVKRWIKKAEFEEPIDFSPLQKSIKWLIL